jgi:Protein of unknown function (DUF2865)
MESRCNRLSWWRAGAIASAAVTSGWFVPVPAHAGFLDFLFGGARQRPPADVNSYAEPPAQGGRVAPASPNGSDNVREGNDTGHGVAFCVRLCDGQHFPLEHVTNSTPVETCRAMCPASKTKVFFGSEISASKSGDGQRYADLDNAFIYRKQLVANCTCNGRDALGLAPYDMTSDPTLRPGDIVATKDGFQAYSGRNGASAAFTPIDTANIEAQLMHTAPVRLSQRGKQSVDVAATQAPDPASDNQNSGTFTSRFDAPLEGLRNQSLR